MDIGAWVKAVARAHPNPSSPALREKGFTDDEIDDWSRTFIAENDGGSTEDLIAWIAGHEGGRPPT